MKINSKQLFKISLATASILALFPILSSNFGLVSEALAATASTAAVADVTASYSSNSLAKVMCNALRIVQGSAGKSFAAFAVIATGIGFFTGKVSWGLMIGVSAGIATMFGGPSIVAAITGETTDMSCTINAPAS